MAWSGTVIADVGATVSLPRVAANAMPAVARGITGTAAANRRAVVPARTMRTMVTPRMRQPPPLAVCRDQRGTFPKVTRSQRACAPRASTRHAGAGPQGTRAVGSAECCDHVVDRLRQLRDVLG